MDEYEKSFKDKKIIITGGVGFIGSNLARKLVGLNPRRIVLVDSLIPGMGGNLNNIRDLEDKVEFPNFGSRGVDMGHTSKMKEFIEGTDFVFNLAGWRSHSGSMQNPLDDLVFNQTNHLSFLEVCKDYVKSEFKREKPKLKIIFSGTRDQYGKVPIEFLPVNEELGKRCDPTDPQGIHKQAAEKYHLLYRTYGLEAVSLRMTNVYGPRHQMRDPGQGILNWFIRQAIDDNGLELWGGGKPQRDFNYIDDVVDALLLVASSDKTDGEIYNLGSCLKNEAGEEIRIGGNIKTINEIAHLITGEAKSGHCVFKAYPEEKKAIEPGDFYADITKINQAIGWEPKVSLEEGIKKTVEFYRVNKQDYW